MYLHINNWVAGLCIMYTTSCFIVIMAIVQKITNTINGRRLHRDDLHNLISLTTLILKFGTDQIYVALCIPILSN